MKSVVLYTRYWWWLLLCALMGAGIFNALLLLFPNQYSSQAQISIAFDQNASLDWDDKSMLKLSESLGNTFYHPETIQAVIYEAESQSIQLTGKEFKQMTGIEQQFYDWVLINHATSPQDAERILQIWVNTSIETLQNEKQELKRISNWESKTAMLVSCIQHLPMEPAHPTCSYGNETNIQTAFTQTLTQEKILKSNLKFLNTSDAAFFINVSQEPTPAVLVHPSWSILLVFGGGLIGFSAGCVSIHYKVPAKIFRKWQEIPS